MKTISTVSFFFLFLLTSNAQVKFELLGKANIPFIKINNSIYPSYSVDVTQASTGYTITTQPNDIYRRVSSKIGFNLGARVSYTFPSKIQLGTGLIWNQFNFIETNNSLKLDNINFTLQELENEIEQQIDYLSIPLKVGIMLKEKFKIGVSLSSNILIHARHENIKRTVLNESTGLIFDTNTPTGTIWGQAIYRDEFGNPTSIPSTSNKISFFEDFNWGGSIDLSYQINSHLFIELEYLKLFNNIYNKQFNDDSIIERKGNLGSLSFGLGFIF